MTQRYNFPPPIRRARLVRFSVEKSFNMASKSNDGSSKEDHIGERHVRRSIAVRLIRHSGEFIPSSPMSQSSNV